MIVWSCLRHSGSIVAKNQSLFCGRQFVPDGTVQRLMSGGGHHRVMNITPSRWQWHKFKDLLHYYAMVGLIPVGLIIFYCNVFIGPAQLKEIPEDYVPKHWEYHRHPITRFISRYISNSPQQEYEKYLHFAFVEDEKAKLRALEKEIKQKMYDRGDYQAYYYRPILAKYARISREAAKQLASLEGDM